jgi:hypothetical protein
VARYRLAAPSVILLFVLGLVGCGLINGLPSQSNPTCSWTSQVPRDQVSVCRSVYRTLQALTRAELRGDDHAIRRLVTNPVVANRIIAFGRQQRAAGLHDIHPSPSLTLGASVDNTLGVGAQIVGHTSSGKFSVPETIYTRLKGGTAYVVNDQPEEEW